MAEPAPKLLSLISSIPHSSQNSRDVVKEYFSNELVFGVVGFAGSGTSTIAAQLKELLKNENLRGGAFSAHIIKTRELLKLWADSEKIEYDKNADEKSINSVVVLQSLGNQLRQGRKDLSAAAVLLVEQIRKKRANEMGIKYISNLPIMPDGSRRAYILDSIKHPAEVELFRRIYGNAFCLVGVVCDEEVKLKRLRGQFSQSGTDQIKEFMKNDAKSIHDEGQRVEKTFYLADFYIDNSEERVNDDGSSNEHWSVSDELSRLIKIVTHAEIVRPRASEVAMYYADCARLSSACLSRQVGAALMDAKGNLVATGANEAPRAGGGVYGESFTEDSKKDYRCAFHQNQDRRHCHSNEHQGKIVKELSAKLREAFPDLSSTPDKVESVLKDSSIGGLLEFSRAIHAEMDAILTASRQGVSPKGTKLFVTTFPCHYCARHVVTAGVDEVQFIEPYPKSKALELHDDAITTSRGDWKPPSDGGTKVLFTPFVGVAPQLYRRAFMKDRDLKDDSTGNRQIGEPDWGSPWDTTRLSFADLELAITKK
ncbi:MAG: deaminase [Magnetococcus sp. YQC-5]